MIKNPLTTDNDGVPLCFGSADESNRTCMEDCPCDLRDRCIDETCTDGDRKPQDIIEETGKPLCFGEHYSGLSPSCQNQCDYTTDCRLETSTSNSLTREPTWLKQTINDAKQDRVFHLPVLQPRPAPSVVSPPVRSVAPVNYWEQTYNRPYQSTYTAPTTGSGLQISLNRPNLTEDQYLHFYGHKPAQNPLVPGQFEGESWWQRLLKEFVIRSLMYAVQVAGQLVVETVGRIRWAPDKTET